MRKLALLALFLCSTFILYSQTASIKGTVVDTSDHKNLENTLVSLLRSRDSVLVQFARANRGGQFSISNLDSGAYIMLITHPYLGDYFDNFSLKPGESREFGNIGMISKSKLLAEVIVKSGAPIRIKGDTTIYTADSFKVREGANVEELLRTLPGIQVDKDGKIIAMGERVTKVLVDGEEFFGSDPGIATKNLRADGIQEVQVFDKKSDQAEFTGIDDGVRDKTINLKMKESRKKGYFGKAELGGGLKDKFNNSLMLNAFQGKRKIAGYFIMSNTGQTNLDWDDAQNYGSSPTTQVTDEGYIYFGGGDDDDDYWGGRNGIPTSWNGGLHYSNKFNNDRQNLNAGYRFSKVNSPGITSTFGKTFLKDTSWFNNTRNENYSSVIKHSLNLTFETQLDSLNSLKWTMRANANDTKRSSRYYAEKLNEESQFINQNNRVNSTESNSRALATTLLWRKKFKKLGRTLSLNTDFNYNESESDGKLLSRIDYFDNGNFLRFDSIDQQNLSDNANRMITTKVAYTEPLVKDVFMEINYSLSYSSSDNDRITNDRGGDGKYETRIDSLSNSFTFNRLVHTPGLTFKLNKKKFNVSVGNTTGFNHFVQVNNSENQKYNYDFVNFFPRVFMQYKIKPNESMRLSYNGSSTAPSLEQLQPIRVNTDPVNIYIGNQDLRQSFRHSVNLGYNFYNPLKQTNMFANANYSTTRNAFTQFNSIDSGILTYQTVNANGPYNLNVSMDYGFVIKGTKLRLGFGPNINSRRNIDFVQNGKQSPIFKNSTVSSGYGARISISYNKESKINFYSGTTFMQNNSKASVNSLSDIKYWTINSWGELQVTLPKKFEINTDGELQMRQKNPNFPNNNFFKWNAALVKRFFKDNALEVRFSIFDILNQNRGYNREFTSSSYTETYYNTLRRFGGVSVIWNISKNGKPAGF